MSAPAEVLVHRASRAQQRLWFAEQVTPGEPVNNINVSCRFRAALEPGALRAALADVIARHESLRTAFQVRDGVLRQVVLAPPAEPPLRTVATADEAAWERLRAGEAGAGFDVAAAPLLRVVHAARAGGDGLVLVVHHLVADAWSTGLLLADLARAYGARAAGRAPDWEPLPVQYADFTAWQEDRLAEPEAQRHLAYWRERLAGLPALDLTRGRPRPERPSTAGRSVPVAVGADLRGRLEAFARAKRATPFMVALAAYAVALGAVFGGQDVAVSSTVAGRPLAEVNDVIGLFVDRVVLRLDLRGRPGFRELVARARDAVVGAHDHAGVTFDQVVDAVQPERRLGVTPLAQAAINMLPPPVRGAGGLPELDAGGDFRNDTAPEDLCLQLDDDGGWRVDYRPAVVADDAAERVARLLPRLLEAGLAAPDRPLCLVPAADEPEPAAWDGGPPADGPATVWDLVAGWIERTPDAAAVASPDGTLSYAELDARARALAARLRRRGVGPEVPVLLALPRSPELVVAMLGVLAAGGAYVPVDPGDPAEHLAAVAADVGARLALTLPGAEVALPAAVSVLAVQGGVEGAVAEAPPATPARPANAAYVLFTSGSTGRPKGVVVEHRSLAAYAGALLRRLEPAPGAVHLMVQAPTFDSCLTAIFGALCSGGVLRLADDVTARDPGLLAALPAEYLKITPGHLTALLAGGDAAGLRPRGAAVLGGEPCSWDLVRRLGDAGWRLLDEYGPTETTVGVLSRWQDGGGEPWTPTPPIGDPLPGVRAHVLDPEGMPSAPGSVGELHVGGVQVGRGYAGQPGRTAEAFVPDPFGRPGARLYRTGDLVRGLPDGSFELVGRRDRQVKVRGVRVEPGAVEAALLRQPGVARAAVALRDGRLTAWVGPADGVRLDPDELTAAAARSLPAAAVPSAVVVLDRLPLTRHGKLDVAALPGPEARAAASREAPATPTEVALAEVWRHALGLAEVGVTDRFFQVGGDSIRAIQVVGEARERGLALTVSQLFEHQSIRPIAALLDGAPPPSRVRRPLRRPEGGSLEGKRAAGLEQPPSGSWPTHLPREGGGASELRREVREVLAGAEALRARGALPDPRPLYLLLGARRLLAAGWPEALGGRGLHPRLAAVIADELLAAGLPDTLHTLSVQICGGFLLGAGTPAQRAALLPGLAAGTRFCTVLYTEPEAGSDLAALTTRAEPAGDGGWRITGRKVYSVQTRYADLALVAARTSEGPSRYDGITLFLVALDAPGVTIADLPSVADEDFADVRLDGVAVPRWMVVGPAGGAWPLVTDALALERTGIEHVARARAWLAAWRQETDEPSDRLRPDAGRLATRTAAAGALSLRCLDRLAAGRVEPVRSAAAKLWCSETARSVAWWCAETRRPEGGRLEAAYREAPGLTLSAGTSEMMLELVAGSGLPLPADEEPLARELRAAVRAVAADHDEGSEAERWAALAELGALALAVPAERGGLGLGLGAELVVCEELGRELADGGLLDTMTATDLTVRPDEPEAVLAGARLRRAAWLAGLAAACLERAVRRTRDRRQFGREVASNQAVAFALARLAVRLEAVRALLRSPGEAAPAGVLAEAAELALAASREAVQLHGAYGMTAGSPVERHYLAAVAALRDEPALPDLWAEAAGW